MKSKFNKRTAIIGACFIVVIAIIVVIVCLFGSGFTACVTGTTKKTASESIKDDTESKDVTSSDEKTVETTKETTSDDMSSSKEDNATTIHNNEQSETVGFTAEFEMVNSWENCYQFNLTVTNNSDKNINSWNIVTKVKDGTKIQQSWNCTCSINGTTLTVKPVDYNGVISGKGSVKDIGIIFESTTKMTNFTYKGTSDSYSDENDDKTEQNTSEENTKPILENYDSYTPPVAESGTPVSNHGQLSVKGTNLVDCKGNKFQIKGVSTHGLAWFPQYVSKDSFKTLRDNWGANVVRLALYSDSYSSGDSNTKESLWNTLESGIEAGTSLGMYVIIDWHILADGNPNTNKTSAIDFWNKVSKKYSKYNNVIYEICNEPNGNTSWGEVKSYADTIIATIRKNDSDAVIIVGTTTWSQDVDQVASNPVKQSENVMYALHFYAATHKEDLRQKLKKAISNGTPVFISEFSICDASGNGGIDYDSANAWKKLINEYNLSYAGWSLCNKDESSALIKSSCSKLSGWTTDDLSDTGKWLRNFISGK